MTENTKRVLVAALGTVFIVAITLVLVKTGNSHRVNGIPGTGTGAVTNTTDALGPPDGDPVIYAKYGTKTLPSLSIQVNFYADADDDTVQDTEHLRHDLGLAPLAYVGLKLTNDGNVAGTINSVQVTQDDGVNVGFEPLSTWLTNLMASQTLTGQANLDATALRADLPTTYAVGANQTFGAIYVSTKKPTTLSKVSTDVQSEGFVQLSPL